MSYDRQMTLVVDGSYGDRSHAGWAAWYRAGEKPFELVGGIIEPELFDVSSGTEAEIAAMALGLVAALDYAPNYAVLLQTDSMRAIKLCMRLLGWHQRPAPGGRLAYPAWDLRPTAVERQACRLMGEVAYRAGVPVYLRHVKAHVHGMTRVLPVHSVHARCDVLARDYMRKARVADELPPHGNEPIGEDDVHRIKGATDPRGTGAGDGVFVALPASAGSNG